MYHQFSIQQFYVQSTQYIYVFCAYLRTYSHYFPTHYQQPPPPNPNSLLFVMYNLKMICTKYYIYCTVCTTSLLCVPYN